MSSKLLTGLLLSACGGGLILLAIWNASEPKAVPFAIAGATFFLTSELMRSRP